MARLRLLVVALAMLVVAPTTAFALAAVSHAATTVAAGSSVRHDYDLARNSAPLVGATVRALSSPYGTGLDGVSCPAQRDCVAVGYDQSQSGRYTPVADEWDGASWTSILSAMSARDLKFVPEAVSCTKPVGCEVVGTGPHGSATPARGDEVPLAARWDGTTWLQQSLPVPAQAINAHFLSISCRSTEFCEAVGYYRSESSGGPCADAWDGTVWKVRALPVPRGTIAGQA